VPFLSFAYAGAGRITTAVESACLPDDAEGEKKRKEKLAVDDSSRETCSCWLFFFFFFSAVTILGCEATVIVIARSTGSVGGKERRGEGRKEGFLR